MKNPITPFLVLVLSMSLVACGSGDDDSAPTASESASATSPNASPTEDVLSGGGPVGIIAIGHSGLTGQSSERSRMGAPVLKNSWATGTNPEVNSIYQRLVAARPETEGHVANGARSGAKAETLAVQAESALGQVPAPELAIIQTINNDIRCDGTDAEHVPEFGTAVENALNVITEASPDTKILIVGALARPAILAEAIADDPEARMLETGSLMCDLFDFDGEIVEEHVATLTGIIEMYEAEQERVCATVPQCSTDDHVFSTFGSGNVNYLGPDHHHLGVNGLAAEAELAWPTVAALLGLPES